MKKWGLVIGILIAMFAYYKMSQPIPVVARVTPSNKKVEISEAPAIKEKTMELLGTQKVQKLNFVQNAGPSLVPPTPAQATDSKITGSPQKQKIPVMTFTIDGGFIVTQGDIILGELKQNKHITTDHGNVTEPQLQKWPSNVIPFHIQPNFPNPGRVHEALAMFAGTTIQFVPFTDQKDVLVFDVGAGGACKSYVGYLGGHQPVIIPNGCSPRDIAHEIMHALGFIHEQNRTDRDDYVEILWDNMDPNFKINFEKFSDAMMLVSGITNFDFESVMIYADTAFSINQQPTMRPKVDAQRITPLPGLSPRDVERINKAY